MPPIFCVVSLERSKGKTSLIEWLVKRLSRSGVRVATIKHSKEPIDLKDKDTYRHLKAGALEVSYVSPFELVTIRRVEASLEDAINSLHVSSDLILVEGFKESPYPKILCLKSLDEAREAVKRISNVIAVAHEFPSEGLQVGDVKVLGRDDVFKLIKKSVIEYWIKRIPGLNCGKCKYGSCAGLADAIRRGEATIRECIMRGVYDARILIDQEEIPLGAWPQQLLRELIMAFVKALKLRGLSIEKAEKILVEVRLKR